MLHRREELSKQRYVSPYHMAYVHTGLGEHDLAMATEQPMPDVRTGLGLHDGAMVCLERAYV